jgi:hypothetical protein
VGTFGFAGRPNTPTNFWQILGRSHVVVHGGALANQFSNDYLLERLSQRNVDRQPNCTRGLLLWTEKILPRSSHLIRSITMNYSMCSPLAIQQVGV